jgi:hypothetical protein
MAKAFTRKEPHAEYAKAKCPQRKNQSILILISLRAFAPLRELFFDLTV